MNNITINYHQRKKNVEIGLNRDENEANTPAKSKSGIKTPLGGVAVGSVFRFGAKIEIDSEDYAIKTL